jgi:exonuclease III
MKLATFNVNGVNGRLPVLLRWLEQSEPDIVCLQELKAAHENFPQAAIAKAGYGAIWHGQKSWNGVAILARGHRPEKLVEACPVIRMTYIWCRRGMWESLRRLKKASLERSMSTRVPSIK